MSSASPNRHAVPQVIQQHLEDAITLRGTRSVLVRAPHVRLRLLLRLDDRVAAHLDGLAVAADAARRMCADALSALSRGSAFTATVRAIESADASQLDAMLALAEASPQARAGVLSAFGWVPPQALRGLTKPLLDSEHQVRRDIGLCVCALHGVNPGPVLEQALVSQANPHALVVAGRLGLASLLPHCLAALPAADPGARFAAARAGLLLGDRETCLLALVSLASETGPCQSAALLLALKVLTADRAHALLKPLAQEPALSRLLIRATGVAGDPHYIPWLIKQMSDPKLTRLAGEAFSLITGLDLAFVDLDCKPPEKPESGPNDDPADTDVAMDEDESLPWPDPGKISAWWSAHGARFKPGTRYFMGEAPSIAHCRSVLRGGFQRQRIAAAEYLCLLTPGTPLFNTAAPAWRQERLLAQMGP